MSSTKKKQIIPPLFMMQGSCGISEKPKSFRAVVNFVCHVERGPTYFTCLLQIPVHHHSDIYSPILPLEEGYRIQAFSRYPYLVQHAQGPHLQLFGVLRHIMPKWIH